MAVARFCDKNGNFDIDKLISLVSTEKESIFKGRDDDLWANTIPTKAQLDRATILILKSPPPKMRMQIVEEKKQAEFATRAVQNRRLSIPVLPVVAADSSLSPEALEDSPTSSKKFTMEFNKRERAGSASVYSDDSRKSNTSPETRKSYSTKTFNFGSLAVHSDEEEEIVESSVYRTICAKKLSDAEIPSPEKKPSRRLSQVGRNFGPSSPLSPQLKSVSIRAFPAIPVVPALIDGMRAATVETSQTKVFQPSPLPGQMMIGPSEQISVASNSDAFLPISRRPMNPKKELSREAVALPGHGAVEILSGSQSEKVSTPTKSGYDWLRNYKCSMRKCVSPITEGWKRPDGGSVQSGRMMAIFETGFYVVGDNEALPMKTEPKSNYQVSAERRKSQTAIQPARNVIPCEQRGMFWTHSSSMQVSGKLAKKSIARKELELIAALASEGGPPGSPERLFHSPDHSRQPSAFKESPYIPKTKPN